MTELARDEATPLEQMTRDDAITELKRAAWARGRGKTNAAEAVLRQRDAALREQLQASQQLVECCRQDTELLDRIHDLLSASACRPCPRSRPRSYVMSDWQPMGASSRASAMIPADLRQLSFVALNTLYGELTATVLPEGRFRGLAWSATLPVWLVAWAWQGKVFDQIRADGLCGRVRNRVLWQLWFPGFAFKWGQEIAIDYSWLRLRDRLKPVTPTLWLGQLRLWGHVVWFTLEADP